eukprot:4371956-Amphidinium_carterae.1
MAVGYEWAGSQTDQLRDCSTSKAQTVGIINSGFVEGFNQLGSKIGDLSKAHVDKTVRLSIESSRCCRIACDLLPARRDAAQLLCKRGPEFQGTKADAVRFHDDKS